MSTAAVQDPSEPLIAVGKRFDAIGWLRATGGNLSVRVAPDTFRITASGVAKGRLQRTDFLDVCASTGTPLTASRKPSAETSVHAVLYAARAEIGAVIHVHSPHVAVWSRRCLQHGACRVRGYELVKALGFWEEDAVVSIPVVPNHHAIPELAAAVGSFASGPVPGVWVAGHGLYAWGDTVADAERHVEAFEELARYAYLDAVLDGRA